MGVPVGWGMPVVEWEEKKGWMPYALSPLQRFVTTLQIGMNIFFLLRGMQSVPRGLRSLRA